MSDKVVIKVLKVPFNTEGLPRGSGSESFPVLPAPVSPSALFVHNFPPSWCFPSHAHALTSEAAAGLALGLFNPLSGGENSLGRKPVAAMSPRSPAYTQRYPPGITPTGITQL